MNEMMMSVESRGENPGRFVVVSSMLLAMAMAVVGLLELQLLGSRRGSFTATGQEMLHSAALISFGLAALLLLMPLVLRFRNGLLTQLLALLLCVGALAEIYEFVVLAWKHQTPLEQSYSTLDAGLDFGLNLQMMAGGVMLEAVAALLVALLLLVLRPQN